MAVDPVNEIKGMCGSSIMAVATSSLVPITRLARAPRPSASSTGRITLTSPMAHKGVLGLGFQTVESPQTRASMEFQAQTAMGKLKAVRMPTVPRGCQVSRMWCPGRSDGMVNP